MSEWFRRQSAKIKTTDKREIVEGMWLKCPQCQEVLYRTMLEENHYTCTNCTHHFRINSNDYIQLLVDNGEFEEILYLNSRKRNLIYKIGTISIGQVSEFLEIDGNDILIAHYEDKFSMGKEPIKISRIVTKFKE